MSARPRKWDIANPGNAAIREELTRAALAAAAESLRGGGDVLDAGCGAGWWLRRLSAEGVDPARLHGIDLDGRRAESASLSLPGAPISAGDVRALPYPDAGFGAVFALTMLSSLPDAESVARAVGECWRVLGPGGVLVVWEPRVPTANRGTRLVRRRDLAAVTGVRPHGPSLTVLPPLARRLGPVAGRAYPPLARVPLLRTHRLHVLRR